MAVNLLAKKRSLGKAIIAQAVKLVEAYHEFERLDNIFVDSGISFGNSDFDGGELAYFDPADMATLITRLREFQAWFEAGTASAAGANTNDILNKAMPGS